MYTISISPERLILFLLAILAMCYLALRGLRFLISVYNRRVANVGVSAGVKGIPTARGVMSHSDWVIKRERLARELAGIQLVAQQQRIEYFSVFPVTARDPIQKEFVRQLEVQQAMLQVEIQELAYDFTRGFVKPRSILDLLKIRAYQWAVYNK